jgi:two-component system sensor histidine kinase/response regulator
MIESQRVPPPIIPIAQLLIVDDEKALMTALCRTLRQEGYLTVGFDSATAALKALQPGAFDIVITDLMMPGMDGITLLRAAREIDGNLVGIVMTGHGTVDTAVEAMKAGALDYILKPFNLSVILPVLSRALTVRRLRSENAVLLRNLAERTQQLEAVNRELVAANDELESFGYSVSHDLRAPLRAIEGFSQTLLEDFAADWPSDAKRHLETVAANARRMEQLIEDLLRFSRLGRQPLATQSVSVMALVREVLQELHTHEPARDISIRLGELPDIQADPALLRQVFVNLLSNALKFTRDKPEAVIELSGKREAGECSYCIRDNGAGFDMRYAEKLFGIFQRLHGQEEFEGTGVGLSIVRRIVERHGGRISADAQVGRGATFNFTLPIDPGPR